MTMATILLTNDFLDRVIGDTSRSTVGKILKRVDLFSDKEVLKKDIKELIYEEYRGLKSLLEAHSDGLLNTRVVTFKSTEEGHC